MATFQVYYNANTKTATAQANNDAPPAGSGQVKIGTFEHDAEADPLDSAGSHVLFHHVRELLYKTKNTVPAEVGGFWPDNVTDMASVTIVNDTTAT